MNRLEVDLTGRVGRFDVSVQFASEAGITALFGPSGAGKTTLLKMIAGIVRPRAGRIAVSDRVLFDAVRGIDLEPPGRRVGFVYQEARLFPHLSVRSNLTYARWAGRRAAIRSFDEVAELLGLERLLDRAPATLSGGERQRVAIGRALLSEPELLMMDEPLSALDQQRRDEILPYLETIRAETNIPILYVSHRVEDVARLADTVVRIETGRVSAQGSAVKVLGRLGLENRLDEAAPGSFLEGTVGAVDTRYHTATVAIDGASIELPGRGFTKGDRVRLRVGASDVAIAATKHDGLSIRNQIACSVEEVRVEDGPHVTVVLKLGAFRLLSRITAKSAAELDLKPADRVVALLKAVSVEQTRIDTA